MDDKLLLGNITLITILSLLIQEHGMLSTWFGRLRARHCFTVRRVKWGIALVRRMSKSVVLSDIMRGFLKFHCVFIATLFKKISFYMMLMLCPVALLNLLVLVVFLFVWRQNFLM